MPDRTINVLAEADGVRDPRRYGRRANELVEKGVLEVSGSRPCSATGRTAQTYRIAEAAR